MQLAAIVLILVAAISKRWFTEDEYTVDPSSSLRAAITVLGIATAAVTLVSLVSRNPAFAVTTVMIAVATILVATAYVFTARTMQPIGAGYPLLLVGLALAIVGIGMKSAEDLQSSLATADERGATRFGKREGRWHIYQNNTAVEIREYKNGIVTSSTSLMGSAGDTSPASPSEPAAKLEAER